MHMQSWLHCERRQEELRATFVDDITKDLKVYLLFALIFLANVDAVCEDSVKCLVPGSTCVGTAAPKMCKCPVGLTADALKTKCVQGFLNSFSI
jgi:hypothetical protein